MWGISCPPVHPYQGLPCVSVLFPSTPVLRKATVNAYPLCLQCVPFTGKNTSMSLVSSPFLTMLRLFEIFVSFVSVACL